MTDHAGGPGPEDHSDLLPWYVSGVLDEAEKRRVTRHLEECSSCRDEVRALSDVQATLRLQARSDHVPVVELVSYEEGGVTPDSPRGLVIHAHLAGCDLCRSDLEASRWSRGILESLEDSGADLVGTTAPRQGGWRFLAVGLAAAAVLALPLAAWLWLRGPAPPARDTAQGGAATESRGGAEQAGAEAQRPGAIGTSPPIRPIQGVLLMPARRDGTPKAVVRGKGPWGVTVVLPFGAPAGPYRLRIETQDGTLVESMTTPLDSTDEDRLMFLLDRDLPEGAYRLIVTPAPAAAPSFTFEFERRNALPGGDGSRGPR